MKAFIILLAAAFLVSQAPAEDKASPKTAKQQHQAAVKSLQGAWRPIAAVMGGARLPSDQVKGITLTIKGTNYNVSVDWEKIPDEGYYQVDTTTTPKRMAITSTNGPNKGMTFLAIWEKKNDYSLRVCYDLSGQEYPKKFRAPRGTKYYAVGYRRQKPKTK